MRGFSKAIIAGNLTRDPELRTIPSGANVCSFSVAVNRSIRSADGAVKEEVSFLDCEAWNGQGETIAKYCHKGDGILVSGRLRQRSWEDKNGGGKRSRVEIVVEDFNFMSRANGANGANNTGAGNFGSSNSTPASNGNSANLDDIPDEIPEGEIDLSEIPF